MLGRKRKHVPESEKKALAQVKRRLDSLEPRVNVLETQLKVMRREAS